jgi:hypothetical protein
MGILLKPLVQISLWYRYRLNYFSIAMLNFVKWIWNGHGHVHGMDMGMDMVME